MSQPAGQACRKSSEEKPCQTELKRERNSMTKQIKVGVVGCGYWGPNLVRNFRSLPDCKLKMMCDLSQERLDPSQIALSRGRGRDGLSSHAQRRRIWTRWSSPPPSTSHYPMAKASLLAGKHTFIEKPMASSSAECEELIDIAQQKGSGADDRPHVSLFAGRPENQGDRGPGRHRRNPLHLRPPAQPRAVPEGHQRGLGPGAA